ncbi:hypothetical protein CEXT_466321 [Caerostris extrusa]|uniref:Uncharacterized protein n=1 Tax=Caerostris extrusa TaxID=172846 RepID=A0AAV4U864_CAEEX|nr:hypothetical protein CEXT_466321 [Caerostris extrusa]
MSSGSRREICCCSTPYSSLSEKKSRGEGAFGGVEKLNLTLAGTHLLHSKWIRGTLCRLGAGEKSAAVPPPLLPIREEKVRVCIVENS